MKRTATDRLIACTYGLACHILFAAAVVAMAYQMAFGMSRGWGALDPPASYIANALLLAQFPLAHSLLLTGAGRRFLARLAPRAIGSDLVTTSYAAIASAQTIVFFVAWSPSGTIWWSSHGGPLVMLMALYAGSWLLLAKAVTDAGVSQQIGVAGWWAVVRDRPVVYGPMPRCGLFRFCRQPIYLAFALTLWTVPTWSPDQLEVACVLTAYCVLGPLFKEKRFERWFGPEFIQYRESVPYWIPGLKLKELTSVSENGLNDQSLYRDYASTWWTGQTRWVRLLRKLVPARFDLFDKAAPTWKDLEVLDLGCGGGFMSEELAHRGARVIGIDPCEAVIAVARSHAADEGLRIDYRVGAGETLPLPDKCMDAVVCVDVLEHVKDVRQVIAETRRVLRPGGFFFFDTINRTRMAGFVIVTLGERVLKILPKGTHDPRGFITPDELERELRLAGFGPAFMRGLGPTGIDRRGDIMFGAWPNKSVMYAGYARLR